MAWAPKKTTPGGGGPRFLCSTRIQLDPVGQIKVEGADAPDGAWIESTIKKNRIDPPGRKARFPLLYESGIDDVWSVVHYLYRKGLLGRSKGWVLFEDQKYRERDFVAKAAADEGLLAQVKGLARVAYLNQTTPADEDEDADNDDTEEAAGA